MSLKTEEIDPDALEFALLQAQHCMKRQRFDACQSIAAIASIWGWNALAAWLLERLRCKRQPTSLDDYGWEYRREEEEALHSLWKHPDVLTVLARRPKGIVISPEEMPTHAQLMRSLDDARK